MSAMAEFGQTREGAEIEALEHQVAFLIEELAFVRDYRDACVLAENEACAEIAERARIGKDVGHPLTHAIASDIRARRSR